MRPAEHAVVARPGLAVLTISSVCWAQNPTPGRSNTWMSEEGGVLRLELSRDGTCRGLLIVDSAPRLLSWQPAQDQAGCSDAFESSFDDVESVRLRDRPGFLLEFKGDKGTRMVLIPGPHAAWLGSERGADPGGSTPTAPPYDVAVDTRRAVDRLQERLGRSRLPGAVVREALYGTPLDKTIPELLESPGSYLGKAVRLRGRLEPLGDDETRYRLANGDHTLAVGTEADLGPFIRSRLPAWKGREVELVGRFRRGQQSAAGGSEYLVAVWELKVEGEPAPAPGRPTTVAALLASPAASGGERVRVVGKFRGRNLFGDLPQIPADERGDWVLKDDRYAIWVVGEPSGEGFTLDPRAPEDMRTWLEVTGVPVMKAGRVVLLAHSVTIVPPPPGGRVLPVRQPIATREASPAVVFALPIEDEPVRPDVRFVIQFSKQMDEESFRGRIRLRYAAGAVDEAFGIATFYDPGLRSLLVDPGELLHVGTQVEIQLLPGIVDTDGMPLEPRPGRKTEGAVDVLRYVVGG